MTKIRVSSTLEVNTRVQVEHPVTKFVTGVNIRGTDSRADGQELSFTQDDTEIRGHAIRAPDQY